MLKLTTYLVQRRVQVSKEVLRLENKRDKYLDKLHRLNSKLAILESDITALEEKISDGKALITRMIELEDKITKTAKTTKTTTAKE